MVFRIGLVGTDGGGGVGELGQVDQVWLSFIGHPARDQAALGEEVEHVGELMLGDEPAVDVMPLFGLTASAAPAAPVGGVDGVLADDDPARPVSSIRTVPTSSKAGEGAMVIQASKVSVSGSVGTGGIQKAVGLSGGKAA